MSIDDDTATAGAVRFSDSDRARLLKLRLSGGGSTATPEPVISRRPSADSDPPLASFAQQRAWFFEQMAPNSESSRTSYLWRITGAFDVAAFERGVDEVRRRHDALRTTFAMVDGQPRQLIADWQPVAIPLVNWSDRTVEQAEADAARWTEREAEGPYDLTTGPLMRMWVIRLSPDRHLLAIVMHHIMFDRMSLGVFWSELSAIYAAFAAGEPSPLPPLPIQYADYGVWQESWIDTPEAVEHREYWRRQLAGAPQSIDLPFDYARPSQLSGVGLRVEFVVPANVVARLRALASSRDSSLFMVLLTTFHSLLWRYSGNSDIVTASPAAGRIRPELEGLIGHFVNQLPIRTRITGDPTFVELLAQVRETALDAYAHEDVPLERIVLDIAPPRDTSFNPLFQIAFDGGREDNPPKLGDLTLELLQGGDSATSLDIQAELGLRGEELFGAFRYSRDLFRPETADRMVRHFSTLLAAVAEDPHRPVSQLPMMTDEERHELLPAWNDTRVDYSGPATLHGLIEQQVARTPGAVALTFEDRSVSYAELNAMANRVAHRLRALGVGPETLVGVCAERSIELVVGLLGVLKAGGAYVPLDPEYPADRIAFMVADVAAPVVLVQEHLRGLVPAADSTVLSLDDDAEWAGERVANPAPTAGPDHLAYVIYTSGSTGRPKGVPNTHRGIWNRLEWMQQTYRLGADDAVLQKTPASFDVSVWEFFWPLRAGARLVLARPGGQKDAGYLRDLLISQRVTTAHFVPSMLAVFLDEAGFEDCATLRRVICSGEELPAAVAAEFVRRAPGSELHNLYGPTEAAVDVSAWHCRPEALTGLASPPIGGPISNLRLYVLDGRLNQVPIGVGGELYIGGAGVARGYHGRPALTAERFVADPFSIESGARLYRTGDRARWRLEPHPAESDGPGPRGVIEFLGRVDQQVKLRGFRIELGEIEAVLARDPAVDRAAVAVRENGVGDKMLVAYVVLAAGREVDPTELRQRLGNELPQYMLPGAVVVLDRLPLTPNGKLDRLALPNPEFPPTEGRPPRTEAERALCALFAEVLGRDTVTIDDNFFEIGGHSLLGVRLITRIRTRLGVGCRPFDLFRNPTVATLAVALHRSGGWPGEAASFSETRFIAMTNPFDDPNGTYVVLVNEEGQHSLWPEGLATPAGWEVVHGPGDRAACLDHVERTWTDMRPLSLVRRLTSPSN
ncbi:amino acid adenylation domain-containing protein [Micromonospora orduensis]|uniref:Amino acid adenylation domain-containing protein n=1 Tax=Micromonospora orduensis TaxID=1420891 RepID=A0A5C4QRN1_9ACTN|nr:non-ribosomal peptide synthetase [Micromonospora orduensis]TNH29632.1 amino acid adenylation domain-containing protein [Micromonospora orduensis]